MRILGSNQARTANPYSTTARPAAHIDAGLRSHMNRVYGYMSAAMVITAVVAYLSSTSTAVLSLIYGTPLQWVVMLAPLGVVFLLSARINKMSVASAQLTFWIFASLMGLSLSYIFLVFTGYSIVQVFLITAIAFAALSLYGYTTKRNLSGMGTFLMMGVIGIIVASIFNIFIQWPALQFGISIIGVLVFAGLTAYDTQNIKNTYLAMAHQGNATWLEKSAIMGALSLYIDFINMFMFLLTIFGQRE